MKKTQTARHHSSTDEIANDSVSSLKYMINNASLSQEEVMEYIITVRTI